MGIPGTMAEVNQFLKASTKNDITLVLIFLWKNKSHGHTKPQREQGSETIPCIQKEQKKYLVMTTKQHI